MDTHQNAAENIFSNYRDGRQYNQHPFFSPNPMSLQLILYYDELELYNPLGSRQKKHKIGTYTMCIKITVIVL